MPRTFILTLGFDSSIVLRAISRHGIGEGDRIVLVTSRTPHPKAESAINEVKSFANRISSGIAVDVVSVEEHDFSGSVKTICNIMSSGVNRRENQLIVDTSGGPRIIGLAVYVAAGLCGLHSVWITTETRSKSLSLPVLVDSLDTVLPSRRQLELLRVLPARPSVIARRLGVSRSAVSKMLRSMEGRGLIVRDGRVVRPSVKAEFLLEVMGDKDNTHS